MKNPLSFLNSRKIVVEDLSEESLTQKEGIKTLVFDLGGVYFTSGTHLTLSKIHEKYQIDDWKSLSTFFGSDPDSEGGKLRLGLISMEEFETRFFQKFAIEEENHEIIRLIWFSNYVPYYLMPKILKNLNKRYRLVAFSGNIRERVEFLDLRYHFLKYFHDSVFSYEYACSKSDLPFYEELIKHIECKPSEAILIDDDCGAVRNAKSLGFHTILFSYTEQFLDALKTYGIELTF